MTPAEYRALADRLEHNDMFVDACDEAADALRAAAEQAEELARMRTAEAEAMALALSHEGYIARQAERVDGSGMVGMRVEVRPYA